MSEVNRDIKDATIPRAVVKKSFHLKYFFGWVDTKFVI